MTRSRNARRAAVRTSIEGRLPELRLEADPVLWWWRVGEEVRCTWEALVCLGVR